MRKWLYYLVLLGVAGCGGMIDVGLAPDGESSVYTLPVLASAGADAEILRGYAARLDGSGTAHPRLRPCSGTMSRPPDCFAVQWEQVPSSPPGTTVLLSNATALSPSFVAPLDEQALQFRLTVNDGTYVTQDDVLLLVRRAPTHLAPRVRAGPDRFLGFNQTAEPLSDDLLELADGGTPSWERVHVSTADGSDASLGISIHRLASASDGLASAPDYLLLFPFDSAYLGQTAPVASLVGDTWVDPGAEITLDAGASSDSNSDFIRFRWQQSRGDALEVASEFSLQHVMAPHRPQEISIRVTAHDGLLESAPQELRIAVGQQGGAPQVDPGADQRARPGRQVNLDALAGLVVTTQLSSQSFAWLQTYGQEVTLDTQSAARTVSFIAPAAPDELAFAVVASAGGIDSAPGVTRVSVVGPNENSPPEVSLSAPDVVSGGSRVTVTARLLDPERDALISLVWEASTDSTASPGSPQPLNFTITQAYDPATGSEQIAFDAPAAGNSVHITLVACDEFSACQSGDLSIDAL